MTVFQFGLTFSSVPSGRSEALLRFVLALLLAVNHLPVGVASQSDTRFETSGKTSTLRVKVRSKGPLGFEDAPDVRFVNVSLLDEPKQKLLDGSEDYKFEFLAGSPAVIEELHSRGNDVELVLKVRRLKNPYRKNIRRWVEGIHSPKPTNQ